MIVLLTQKHVSVLLNSTDPHPDKIQKIDNNFVKSYLGKESMVARQKLPKVYALNGALYFTHREVLLKLKTFLPPKTIPYIMPDNRSINLDNMQDIYVLEAMLTHGLCSLEEIRNLNLSSFPAKALKKLPQFLYTKLNSFVNSIFHKFDFLAYAWNVHSYKRLSLFKSDTNAGGLLIVSGRGMNIVWAQIWTLLSLCGRSTGLRPYVLTTKSQKHLNQYFSLLEIEQIYFDDLLDSADYDLPQHIADVFNYSFDFQDIRNLSVDNIPIGDIALSTYCRYHGTGLIDTNSESTRIFIKHWVGRIWNSIVVSTEVYKKYNIKVSFHSEVFMEEYGGIYYTALNHGVNIVRFCGTVRDDAYVIQHRTWKYDRLHHAALSNETWNEVKK